MMRTTSQLGTRSRTLTLLPVLWLACAKSGGCNDKVHQARRAQASTPTQPLAASHKATNDRSARRPEGEARFVPVASGWYKGRTLHAICGTHILDLEKEEEVFGGQPKDGVLLTDAQLSALDVACPDAKVVWIPGPRGSCRAALGQPRVLLKMTVGSVVGMPLQGCAKGGNWAPLAATSDEEFRWLPIRTPQSFAIQNPAAAAYTASLKAAFATSPLAPMASAARRHNRTERESVKTWISRVPVTAEGAELVEVALNKYYPPKKKADYNVCDPNPPREFIVRQWGLSRGSTFKAAHTSAYVRAEPAPNDGFLLKGALVGNRGSRYAVFTAENHFGSFDIYSISDGQPRLITRQRYETGDATENLADDTPYDQGPRCHGP